MAQTSRSADLTSGPMLQKIILFSIPLAASSILQLLFNAADIVVVGKFAGDNSLAAVGSNAALINLMVNLFVGLSVGANILAARYTGAGNRESLRQTVHTSMLLAFLSGILLAVVGVTTARPLLHLMQVPDSILPLAALYLRIYFLGMPAAMLYNFGAALLRRALFTQLMVEVNRVSLAGDTVSAAAGDSKIVAILQYLNAHLTEGLTIDELAARFYISKYHMMRRFRDETGYTIHGYVTEKRLLLAQQLLEQGIPSGEAALRCGYQEYSTFSRAYKKQFDRSPSER